MTNDNEEESLDSSTSTGAENVESPATTADAATRESSVAEPTTTKTEKPKPSNRESLIKELTGNKSPQAEDDEEDETEEDEEEADEAETAPKSEEVVEKTEEVPGVDGKIVHNRKRFEVLTKHNKELKTENETLKKDAPVTEYGKSVLNFCKEAQLSVEDLSVLLAFGAELKRDKAAARTRLKALGLEPEVDRQVVKEVPAELDDVVLDLVANGDITPDGMKKLLGTIRTARTAVPPPAAKTPPPAAPPARSTQQPLAVPISPEAIEYNKALAKVQVDIDLKDGELATKYPADWPKIRDQVKTGMTRYKGTHPSQWLGFFNDEVNKALAKIKRPAAPTQTQVLRPSTTTSASKPAPTGRAALVAELTTGKFR